MTEIYTLLKQYDDLIAERTDIARRISQLDHKLKELEKTIVSDSVEGTRTDGTYGSIRIEGIPIPEYDIRLVQLTKKREQYSKIETHLQELVDQIDSEIMSVTDPSVRTIIRYRYVDKMKWEKVARMMHMGVDQCRKRMTRYFDKKSESNT